MTRSSGAILSDSERANALIRAHWPKALRWMLEGEPARPIDPSLVHVDLRQTRADKVYLVGGTPDKPNAVAPIEHISSPGPDVSGQVAASLRGLQAPFAGKDMPWAVPFAFSTRRLSWNVPGAIDETGSGDRYPAAADLGRRVFRAGHPDDPLRGALAGACIPRHGRHDEHRLPYTVPGG